MIIMRRCTLQTCIRKKNVIFNVIYKSASFLSVNRYPCRISFQDRGMMCKQAPVWWDPEILSLK